MGYKPFEWGEQLNPDKLNSKFSQVFSLVTKALAHNKILKERIKMLSTAFEAVSTIVDTVIEDDNSVSLIYDVPSNYKYYDAGIGDNSYQLFIGGEQLVLDTGPTTVLLSGVTSDGLNVILDSVEGEIPVSRIPLVDSPFGEIVPSAGVSVTSNEFKGDLTFILSPTNLWAQKVPVSELVAAGAEGYKGSIEIDVPDTLSPYMNTLVVSPTIGTRYRAYYTAGNVWKEITNDYTVGKQTFYLDADLFTGQLLLELVGVEVEAEFMSFGINSIEAYYTKFVDVGLLTATYELGNVETAATITGITTNVEMGDMLQLVVKNSVDEVVYDSELHGFPYPVSGTNSFDLGGKILKYEIHLTKKRDTTPALPFLTFNYKETV